MDRATTKDKTMFENTKEISFSEISRQAEHAQLRYEQLSYQPGPPYGQTLKNTINQYKQEGYSINFED